LEGFLGIEDLRARGVAGDESRVAQLSAGFAIERSAVEGELPFLARRDLLRALSLDEDGLQRRLRPGLLVPEELVLAHLAGERPVCVGDRRLAGAGEGTARALLL